jgi:hypothetical protein
LYRRSKHITKIRINISYYFLFGDQIIAFPEGFEMIAGDSSRRNHSIPIPDPPLSLWGPADKTQLALSQKALGFNCLNYHGHTEGALTRHFLPDKSFIDLNCADGLRLELMFPSCWDGSNLYASNNKSHIAYPDLVMEGNCPSKYESRIPALYFETIWDTPVFRNASGRFLLSNGDDTGMNKQLFPSLILTCLRLRLPRGFSKWMGYRDITAGHLQMHEFIRVD